MSDKTLTRSDLESKFRDIQSEVDTVKDESKSTLTMAGIAGGVLLLLIVFLLGSRRGKRKTTVVEIRRI